MRRVLIRVGLAVWGVLAVYLLVQALPPRDPRPPDALTEFLGTHLEFVAQQGMLEKTERAKVERIHALTRPLLIRAHVHRTKASIPPGSVSVPMGDGTWLAARPPPPSPAPWRRLGPPFALLTAMGLTGVFVSRRFLADLGRIEAAVSAIRQDDMSVRIDDVGPTVQPLADAINQLVGRVEGLVSRQSELLQAVSHELRTPLTRLELELEALSDRLPDGALTGAHEEMDALDALISELVTWLRVESAPGQRTEFSIAHCVDAAVRRAEVLAPHLTLTHRSPDVQIVAGESDITRILDNALGNATRCATDAVFLRTEVSVTGELTLEVHDDGPGFPGDPVRLTEPFVKGDDRAAHGGSGLGLSIVHRIVSRYRGSLALEKSAPLGGACLIARLKTGMAEG